MIVHMPLREQLEKDRAYFFSVLVKIGLLIFVILLFVVLAVYVTGDFFDEEYLSLLWTIRSLAFFVSLCAIFALALNIRRMIRRPVFMTVLGILVYLFFALLGAGILIFSALFVAFAAGNR